MCLCEKEALCVSAWESESDCVRERAIVTVGERVMRPCHPTYVHIQCRVHADVTHVHIQT
jgi:hypothetical protein